jgi:4-hydroxy-2-oxoheptanedioate aldolase
MTTNLLQDNLGAGRTALGAWMFLREPALAHAAARLEYDYVCIDVQHGLQSFDDVTAMLAAIAGGTATPMVRTPWNEPGLVGRFLDAGALGIIFPMIDSADDARRAVAACRYAPDGERSLGPIGAGLLHGPDYGPMANDVVMPIPMIETASALEHLDEILAVDGVDTIYVGPADLALSMGLRPGLDNDDPSYGEAITAIVEGCRRHGVVPGIHCSPQLADKRAAQGFRMLSVGYDFGPAMAALRADLQVAQGAVGRDRQRPASGAVS